MAPKKPHSHPFWMRVVSWIVVETFCFTTVGTDLAFATSLSSRKSSLLRQRATARRDGGNTLLRELKGENTRDGGDKITPESPFGKRVEKFLKDNKKRDAFMVEAAVERMDAYDPERFERGLYLARKLLDLPPEIRLAKMKRFTPYFLEPFYEDLGFAVVVKYLDEEKNPEAMAEFLEEEENLGIVEAALFTLIKTPEGQEIAEAYLQDLPKGEAFPADPEKLHFLTKGGTGVADLFLYHENPFFFDKALESADEDQVKFFRAKLIFASQDRLGFKPVSREAIQDEMQKFSALQTLPFRELLRRFKLAIARPLESEREAGPDPTQAELKAGFLEFSRQKTQEIIAMIGKREFDGAIGLLRKQSGTGAALVDRRAIRKVFQQSLSDPRLTPQDFQKIRGLLQDASLWFPGRPSTFASDGGRRLATGSQDEFWYASLRIILEGLNNKQLRALSTYFTIGDVALSDRTLISENEAASALAVNSYFEDQVNQAVGKAVTLGIVAPEEQEHFYERFERGIRKLAMDIIADILWSSAQDGARKNRREKPAPSPARTVTPSLKKAVRYAWQFARTKPWRAETGAAKQEAEKFRQEAAPHALYIRLLTAATVWGVALGPYFYMLGLGLYRPSKLGAALALIGFNHAIFTMTKGGISKGGLFRLVKHPSYALYLGMMVDTFIHNPNPFSALALGVGYAGLSLMAIFEEFSLWIKHSKEYTPYLKREVPRLVPIPFARFMRKPPTTGKTARDGGVKSASEDSFERWVEKFLKKGGNWDALMIEAGMEPTGSYDPESNKRRNYFAKRLLDLPPEERLKKMKLFTLRFLETFYGTLGHAAVEKYLVEEKNPEAMAKFLEKEENFSVTSAALFALFKTDEGQDIAETYLENLPMVEARSPDLSQFHFLTRGGATVAEPFLYHENPFFFDKALEIADKSQLIHFLEGIVLVSQERLGLFPRKRIYAKEKEKFSSFGKLSFPEMTRRFKRVTTALSASAQDGGERDEEKEEALNLEIDDSGFFQNDILEFRRFVPEGGHEVLRAVPISELDPEKNEEELYAFYYAQRALKHFEARYGLRPSGRILIGYGTRTVRHIETLMRKDHPDLPGEYVAIIRIPHPDVLERQKAVSQEKFTHEMVHILMDYDSLTALLAMKKITIEKINGLSTLFDHDEVVALWGNVEARSAILKSREPFILQEEDVPLGAQVVRLEKMQVRFDDRVKTTGDIFSRNILAAVGALFDLAVRTEVAVVSRLLYDEAFIREIRSRRLLGADDFMQLLTQTDERVFHGKYTPLIRETFGNRGLKTQNAGDGGARRMRVMRERFINELRVRGITSNDLEEFIKNWKKFDWRVIEDPRLSLIFDAIFRRVTPSGLHGDRLERFLESAHVNLTHYEKAPKRRRTVAPTEVWGKTHLRGGSMELEVPFGGKAAIKTGHLLYVFQVTGNHVKVIGKDAEEERRGKRLPDIFTFPLGEQKNLMGNSAIVSIRHSAEGQWTLSVRALKRALKSPQGLYIAWNRPTAAQDGADRSIADHKDFWYPSLRQILEDINDEGRKILSSYLAMGNLNLGDEDFAFALEINEYFEDRVKEEIGEAVLSSVIPRDEAKDYLKNHLQEIRLLAMDIIAELAESSAADGGRRSINSVKETEILRQLRIHPDFRRQDPEAQRLVAKRIVEERRHQQFTSADDFVARMQGKVPGIKKEQWEALAKTFSYEMGGWTRRKFLKTAGMGAGAVALGAAIKGIHELTDPEKEDFTPPVPTPLPQEPELSPIDLETAKVQIVTFFIKLVEELENEKSGHIESLHHLVHLFVATEMERSMSLTGSALMAVIGGVDSEGKLTKNVMINPAFWRTLIAQLDKEPRLRAFAKALLLKETGSYEGVMMRSDPTNYRKFVQKMEAYQASGKDIHDPRVKRLAREIFGGWMESEYIGEDRMYSYLRRQNFTPESVDEMSFHVASDPAYRLRSFAGMFRNMMKEGKIDEKRAKITFAITSYYNLINPQIGLEIKGENQIIRAVWEAEISEGTITPDQLEQLVMRRQIDMEAVERPYKFFAFLVDPDYDWIPKGERLRLREAKDGGDKETEWPELAYHLKRLETHDPEIKIAELGAIQEGLSRHPLVPREKVLEHLLDEYSKTKGAVLKSHLLSVLIHLGIRSPQVQDIFEKELRDKLPLQDYASTLLLQETLMAFAGTLRRSETISLNPETVETLKKLLHHPNEEVAYAALYVFVNAFRGALQGHPILKPSDLIQDPFFVQRLQHLVTAREIRTAYLSEELIAQLGLSHQTQDPAVGGYVEWLEKHALQKQEINPQLSAEELGTLYAFVQENGKPPRQFIGDLFRTGKKVVFVSDVTHSGDSLPFLAEDILALKEEVGLNRVALPFPQSEAENLQRFSRGEVELQNWEYGKRAFLTAEGDPEGLAYAASFRQMMRELNGKVRFIFYGKGMDEGGEFAVMTQLKPIQDSLRELAQPRILVLGIPLMGAQLARKHLKTHYDWVTLSIAHELGEEIGKDRIASFLQVDEEKWFWDHFADTHNLVEVIEQFPITESFAIETEETLLARLQFSRVYQQPFGSAWDGILFRKTGSHYTAGGKETVWHKQKLGAGGSGVRAIATRFGGVAWIEAGSYVYRIWVDDEAAYFQRHLRPRYTPRGNVYRLGFNNLLTVGRSSSQPYHIDDPRLSEIHFTIAVSKDRHGQLGLAIEDKNSQTGTKIAWLEAVSAQDGGERALVVERAGNIRKALIQLALEKLATPSERGKRISAGRQKYEEFLDLIDFEEVFDQLEREEGLQKSPQTLFLAKMILREFIKFENARRIAKKEEVLLPYGRDRLTLTISSKRLEGRKKMMMSKSLMGELPLNQIDEFMAFLTDGLSGSLFFLPTDDLHLKKYFEDRTVDPEDLARNFDLSGYAFVYFVDAGDYAKLTKNDPGFITRRQDKRGYGTLIIKVTHSDPYAMLKIAQSLLSEEVALNPEKLTTVDKFLLQTLTNLPKGFRFEPNLKELDYIDKVLIDILQQQV